MAFLGYGYKARGSVNSRYSRLPTRMRNYLLMLTYPGAPYGVTLDQWVSSLGVERFSKRDLEGDYRTLVGVATERLHDRLRSLAPLIDRA